jgi:hypothetical protein
MWIHIFLLFLFFSDFYPVIWAIVNRLNLGLFKKHMCIQIGCPILDITPGRDFLLSRLEQKSSKPQFYFIYTGAMHSNIVDADPYATLDTGIRTYPDVYERFEKEEYPFVRRKADENLISMLDIIYKYDPDALVILIGDHGAHRYAAAQFGKGDVNALIRACGIEPSLAASDHVGTLLAIKWPIPHYSEGKVISHVNLFRHVFAALAEDPSLLKDCEPNESYVQANGKLYKVVKDGVPLLNWEEFTSPEK